MFSEQILQQTTTRTLVLPYLVWTPPSASGPLPTVVYLHGAGAKGQDLEAVRREPLPRLVADGMPFPFLLLCPQCPPDAPGWSVESLWALWSALPRLHNADPDRIALTGISMGGRGCYEFAYWHADAPCALVPLCGFGLPNLAPRLRSLPLWAFHGERDATLPVERTEEMIAALGAAGAQCRYDRLQGAGHNIGALVYPRPELWAWVAKQRRGESAL